MIMAKRTLNNIRLGLFVLAGLFFLILTLYFLGKNRNLFGSSFALKAQFKNVSGLRSGNNVRFAGIEVGTVKKVKIVSDTLVEVTMMIDTKIKRFIFKNAEVTIGTDGLMGNKLVNIVPVKEKSAPVKGGDMLVSKKITATDVMLETLDKTNNNIAFISEELKETVRRINQSKALWTVLNDLTLSPNLRSSLYNIQKTSVKAKELAGHLNDLVTEIKKGSGSVGALLTDTVFSHNLNEAVYKIQQVGDNANVLTAKLNDLADTISSDVRNGNGAMQLLLKDSVLSKNISASMENIEKATNHFNQNMEALQHNILFRGYFRKLEKEKARSK
jgi:phospholipid/cholesterol/gamma-HCH transport system substrate-binding protein